MSIFLLSTIAYLYLVGVLMMVLLLADDISANKYAPFPLTVRQFIFIFLWPFSVVYMAVGGFFIMHRY